MRKRAAGYDAMKVMTNLRPEVYDAILAASAKHEFPVDGHAPTRVDLRRALGQGQRSFEHLLDFSYALLPDDSSVRSELVRAYERKDFGAIFDAPYRAASSSGIPTLAAEIASSGVWICPTLVVTQRFLTGPVELEALRRSPVLAFVPPDTREGWEAFMARRPSFLSEDGMQRGFVARNCPARGSSPRQRPVAVGNGHARSVRGRGLFRSRRTEQLRRRRHDPLRSPQRCDA